VVPVARPLASDARRGVLPSVEQGMMTRISGVTYRFTRQGTYRFTRLSMCVCVCVCVSEDACMC
jgi:hypothetical protein